MGEEVVVVGFNSGGMIKAVIHMEKSCAENCARQLRRAYPSVKCMSYDEFVALQDKEQEEYWKARSKT